MIKTINATDAARTFSELLNSVKYKGDRFTIVRGGKPAASIGPVESVPQKRTLGELRMLMKSLPGIGEDSALFAHDIEEALRKQPSIPEKDSWE